MLKELSSQQLPPTIAILWDGKKTDTMEREVFNLQRRPRNVINKREHVVLVDMQNRSFIGEFIPKSGCGKDKAEAIKAKLIEKGIHSN